MMSREETSRVALATFFLTVIIVASSWLVDLTADLKVLLFFFEILWVSENVETLNKIPVDVRTQS